MRKKRTTIAICGLLLTFSLILTIVYVGLGHRAEDTPPLHVNPTLGNSVGGKWNEGVIAYKGSKYKYNFSMETYLCLGIDKEGKVQVVADGIDGGQSDAIFLLAIDHNSERISVIGINRNTMTAVDMYDTEGNFVETRELQLCLQHGYGDGADISCSRSVAAVENLFHGIPIDGYFSLNMGGIPILNDAVGGVTLRILETIATQNDSGALNEGDYVTLTGEEAYTYVRYRNIKLFDSASMRLERQMQYILALFAQMKAYTNGSATKAVGIFESGKDYICTNVIYADLAEALMQYSFDEANMYSIEGRTIKGDKFEEYHVDQMALQDLILEVFYEKVG